MKSNALSHSNSMIIIQVYTKFPSATWKVLKNAKCSWSSWDSNCSIFFLSHNSFAECFTKKKNRKHFHHPTAYYYSRGRRAVGMLQQFVLIVLPVCIGHRSFNASVWNAWRPENDESSLVYLNCDICQQETRICRHSRGKTAYFLYTSTLP